MNFLRKNDHALAIQPTVKLGKKNHSIAANTDLHKSAPNFVEKIRPYGRCGLGNLLCGPSNPVQPTSPTVRSLIHDPTLHDSRWSGTIAIDLTMPQHRVPAADRRRTSDNEIHRSREFAVIVALAPPAVVLVLEVVAREPVGLAGRTGKGGSGGSGC